MNKTTPIFRSAILLVLVATASLGATAAYAESAANPFADSTPKFSGFYGNLGLAYNSVSGLKYTETIIQPYPPAAVSGTASASNFVSGLVKLGYAFRMGQRGYLGIAGFYNASAEQKNLDANFATVTAPSAGSPVLTNTVTQTASYGVMLEPGLILNPYSLLYLNLGAQMSSMKFASKMTNVGSSPVAVQDVSTSKSIAGYILGLGYQHQMNFIKSPAARNVSWFTELNYGTGSKTEVAQSFINVPQIGPATGHADTYSYTPSALQVVVGVNYYF